MRLSKRNTIVFYFHACNRCYLEAFQRIGFVDIGHYRQRNFVLSCVSARGCQVKNKFIFGYRNFCRYAACNCILAIVFGRSNKRIVLRLSKRNATVFYFHPRDGCHLKTVQRIGFVDIGHYRQRNFVLSCVSARGCKVKNKFVFDYRNFCRYAVCNRILTIVFGRSNKRVVLRLSKRNTIVFYFHPCNRCYLEAFQRIGFVDIGHYRQRNFILSFVSALGCQVKNKFIFGY